jgi:integrase
MPDTRLALNDRVIAALPLASSGQYFARDTELSGFAVLIGKRTKTFVVQGDIRKGGLRISIRIKVAEVGDLSTRKARAQGKELLAKIAKGIDPREKKRIVREAEQTITHPTLRQAWERYRDAHMKRKGRSDGTIENYRDHVERLMADWLDRPLSVLGNDPALVTARHDKITTENGPYIANGCMRSLRAIYNHARKTTRSLPADNPAAAIDWNREKRRDTALGVGELGGWTDSLAKLENPVRREFHLFLLLSGSRPDALKHARVEHIDFRARILHMPKPKGGEAKAFDIPLSHAMIRCLVRARRLCRLAYPAQAQDWVFPADSVSGHLVEHKEDRGILPKWGNDLRQTYRTVGQAAGIGELDIHLLMNHSIAGVNAGYITRGKLLNDHLRQQQEIVSRKIVDAVRAYAKRGETAVAKWLFLPSRRVLRDLCDAETEEGSAVRAGSELSMAC